MTPPRVDLADHGLADRDLADLLNEALPLCAQVTETKLGDQTKVKIFGELCKPCLAALRKQHEVRPPPAKERSP